MNLPTRREKIEAMLVEEPNDRFLRYALALELEKGGEHRRSLELLTALMSEDPPHVPSFLMGGQQLASQGRIEEAQHVLRSGIEAARAQGDAHAASEMSELVERLSAELRDSSADAPPL